MNKKQIFSLALLVIFALSILAPALAYDVTDEELIPGDDLLSISKTDLRTKISNILDFQAFTVIDGAVCSTEPDFSKRYSTSSLTDTQLCKSNYQYTGIAFQLHEILSDGRLRLIGEKQIPFSSKGCFTIEPNTPYHMTFYYCDETASRSCSDSDGGKTYATKGTVTYEIEGRSNSYTDKCISSSELQEFYCVDNSVSSNKRTCACQDGRCTDEETFVGPREDEEKITVIEKKLSINLYDVSTERSALIDEKFVVKGKASINGICNGCVVETGIDTLGQALALTSEGGACGDDKTVGVKITAENKVIEFYLVDKSSKAGNFRVPIRAYDRCGGALLDEEFVVINIENPPAPEEYVLPSEPLLDDEPVVTCYSCVGDTFIANDFKGTVCPDGTSLVSPDCSNIDYNNYNNNEGDANIIPSTGDVTESNPVVILPNEELSKEKSILGMSASLFWTILIGIILIIIASLASMRGSSK